MKKILLLAIVLPVYLFGQSIDDTLTRARRINGKDDDTVTRARRINRKADEILANAEVFTWTAVAFGGELPEANWAFSVIYNHSDDALARFQRIYRRANTPGKVFCLFGIRHLDKATYERMMAEANEKLKKEYVVTLKACEEGGGSVEEVLAEAIKEGIKSYCLSKIPELYETVRVRQ